MTWLNLSSDLPRVVRTTEVAHPRVMCPDGGTVDPQLETQNVLLL